MLAGAAAAQVDGELIDEMQREIDRHRSCAEADDLEGFLVSDRAFHDLLYERAQMPRTRDIVLRLRDVADRYIYCGGQPHRSESICEHELLLEHCAEGDRVKLQKAVEAHIRRGRDMLLEQFMRAEAERVIDPAATA